MAGPVTLDSLQYQVHREMSAYFRFGARPVDADIYSLAVARGLDRLLPLLPPVETSVTAATSGRVHDIGSLLDDIYGIVGLAFPWTDDAQQFRSRPFEEVDYHQYRFENALPQAGDTIRVRYLRRYHIQGLEGADATTLPDDYVRPLVLLAASEGLSALAARLPENNQQALLLKEGAQILGEGGEMALYGLRSPSTVSWPEIGL